MVYLVSLNLSSVGLQADNIQTLTQGSQMTQLQKLDLSSNLLTPQAVQHVLEANWTQLLALNLADAGLKTDSIEILAQAFLPKLQDLNLSHNRLSPRAADLLVQGSWSQLTHLKLVHALLMEDPWALPRTCSRLAQGA